MSYLLLCNVLCYVFSFFLFVNHFDRNEKKRINEPYFSTSLTLVRFLFVFCITVITLSIGIDKSGQTV